MKFLKLLKTLLIFTCVTNATEEKRPILDMPGVPLQLRTLTIDDYTFLTPEQKELCRLLPPAKDLISKSRTIMESKAEVMPQDQIDVEKVKSLAKQFFKETLGENELGTYLYSVAQQMIDNGNYEYTEDPFKIYGQWELNFSKEDYPPFDWPDLSYMKDNVDYEKYLEDRKNSLHQNTESLIDTIIFYYNDDFRDRVRIREACENSEKVCSEEAAEAWISKIKEKFRNPFNSKINLKYQNENTLFDIMIHETGHALDCAYMSKIGNEPMIATERVSMYFEIKSQIYAAEKKLFDKGKFLNLSYLEMLGNYIVQDLDTVILDKLGYGPSSEPISEKLSTFFQNLHNSDINFWINLTDDPNSEYCYTNEKIAENEKKVHFEGTLFNSQCLFSDTEYAWGFAKALELIEANTPIEDVFKTLTPKDQPPITRDGFKKVIDYLMQ